MLILNRFAYSPMGTFGSFMLDTHPLFTVEQQWIGNERHISCIPEGTYICKPRKYNKGGYDAIEITDVPGRSHILFHVGNTQEDVSGCIAVGERLGCLSSHWAVMRSRKAFNELMEWAETQFRDKGYFHLIIRSQYVSTN